MHFPIRLILELWRYADFPLLIAVPATDHFRVASNPGTPIADFFRTLWPRKGRVHWSDAAPFAVTPLSTLPFLSHIAFLSISADFCAESPVLLPP
jgi:hypothetical protein